MYFLRRIFLAKQLEKKTKELYQGMLCIVELPSNKIVQEILRDLRMELDDGYEPTNQHMLMEYFNVSYTQKSIPYYLSYNAYIVETWLRNKGKEELSYRQHKKQYINSLKQMGFNFPINDNFDRIPYQSNINIDTIINDTDPSTNGHIRRKYTTPAELVGRPLTSLSQLTRIMINNIFGEMMYGHFFNGADKVSYKILINAIMQLEYYRKDDEKYANEIFELWTVLHNELIYLKN